MKHKFTAVILAAMLVTGLLFGVVFVHADEDVKTEGKIRYMIGSDGSVTFVELWNTLSTANTNTASEYYDSATGKMHYRVPATLAGYPVNYIERGAFLSAGRPDVLYLPDCIMMTRSELSGGGYFREGTEVYIYASIPSTTKIYNIPANKLTPLSAWSLYDEPETTAEEETTEEETTAEEETSGEALETTAGFEETTGEAAETTAKTEDGTTAPAEEAIGGDDDVIEVSFEDFTEEVKDPEDVEETMADAENPDETEGSGETAEGNGLPADSSGNGGNWWIYLLAGVGVLALAAGVILILKAVRQKKD